MYNFIKNYVEKQSKAIIKTPYEDIEKFCNMFMEARGREKEFFLQATVEVQPLLLTLQMIWSKDYPREMLKDLRLFHLLIRFRLLQLLQMIMIILLYFQEQLKNYAKKGDFACCNKR